MRTSLPAEELRDVKRRLFKRFADWVDEEKIQVRLSADTPAGDTFKIGPTQLRSFLDKSSGDPATERERIVRFLELNERHQGNPREIMLDFFPTIADWLKAESRWIPVQLPSDEETWTTAPVWDETDVHDALFVLCAETGSEREEYKAVSNWVRETLLPDFVSQINATPCREAYELAKSKKAPRA